MATLQSSSPIPPTLRLGDQEGKNINHLRTVMPLQAMHRTSPLRLRNRISPDTELIPRLDLSPVIVGKSRAWLGAEGITGDRGATHMRRTASLDAIFLKGSKETESRFSLLLLNKATQTPEDWIPCCLLEVPPRCSGCAAETSNGSLANSCANSSSSSRRPSGSVPASSWPTGGVPPPGSGENIEKFIRQRLQRANKEGVGAAGSRHSPIHGDHSVLARPYACVQTHVCTSTEGAIRSASVPQLPRPLLPRFRSSVEELNQEIERLVLRPQSHHGSEDEEEWGCPQQDGRRAPIPDYFRVRRSVNTQTPARYSSCASGNGSDQSTSPSLSPTTLSPPPDRAPAPPDSPPGPPRLHAVIASPHINKFLAREPPDGCERVALRPSEEKSGAATASWPPATKPSATPFTLLPSLGSAFCAPGRTSGPGRGPGPGREPTHPRQEVQEGSKAELGPSPLESAPQKTREREGGSVPNLTMAKQ